jgi:predicted membrane-bound mannosyltransferase/DNA-binding beta-propeller fold protein YncE
MLNKPQEKSESWLDKPLTEIIKPNLQTVLLGLILVAAVFTRLYLLGERVMSHDEINHVYFAWQFYDGGTYVHNPITHGPLQFLLLEWSYFLFNVSDFTARIPSAFFSVLTIVFIWQFRRYLGRTGAIVSAVFFIISPYMLYYGRYARNESIAIFFTLATVWAVLRYLDTGKNRYIYYSAAFASFHFATKETAFIFTALLLIYLGLLFIYRVSKRDWEDKGQKITFLILLGLAALLLIVALGSTMLSPEPPVLEQEGEAVLVETGPEWISLLPIIFGGLASLSFLAAFIILLIGFGWSNLRVERSFEMILFQLLLVFPQLAAFPAFFMGLPVSDFINIESILKVVPYLAVFFFIAMGVGIFWNWRVWLTGSGIYYAIFTVFFTTIFTNLNGIYTGLIGSLGYWLEQQAVERGSQPDYYFTLIQLPIYEYLAFLGAIIGLIIGAIWLIKRNTDQEAQPLDLYEQPNPPLPIFEPVPAFPAEDDQSLPAITALEERFDPQEIPEELPAPIPTLPEVNHSELPEIYSKVIAISMLLFFSFTSIYAYTQAGEKMPWLTVHISWAMWLVTGWLVGKLINRVEWKAVLTQKGAVALVWFALMLITFLSAIGMLINGNAPFQGNQTEQLNNTTMFLLMLLISFASGVALIKTTDDWEKGQPLRFTILAFFGTMALLTARSAYNASYIYYDQSNEYLVYAHAARGPKDALEQIEDISVRLTGGTQIKVGYDNHAMYPFWWYLREYDNRWEFGENPTVELREYPLILVGDGNYHKIDPIVRDDYLFFEYPRMVWPNQDYFNLDFYKNYLADPETRGDMLYALFQVWFNRDFKYYGQVTGQNVSPRYWNPSQTFRLYIRKDMVYQIWEYGSSPGGLELMVDEYAQGQIDLKAQLTINDLGLLQPRGIASAPDGSIYVADSGNSRILHIDQDGILIGQVGGEGAAVSQFNQPWGLTVDPAGYVYVADTWNHRVQKFTLDLEYVTSWGQYGQAEIGDAFWGPRDIAIDLDGNVLVADTGNKRIVVFDDNGGYITEFGGAGYQLGQLEEPVGVAISPIDNAVFVADTWNQRVQVFENTVSLDDFYISTRQWDIDGWFGQSLENKPYLTVDELNNLLVADPENGRVLIFSSEGTFIGYFGEYDLIGEHGFGLVSGISADGQGGVWVTDSVKNEIKYFILPR